MADSFDNSFTTDTTPFDFDSVTVAGGDTLEVLSLGISSEAADSGAGIRTSGGSSSSSPAVTQHNSYPFLQYMGIGATWKQIQPTAWDGYVTPPWFETAFNDAKADALAGNPYKIGVRIFCGADAPVGPTGAAWMIGGAKPANNSKPVEVVNLATTDSNSGATAAENVPMPNNVNYRYHYSNLIDWLQAYLHPSDASGLTDAGTRRSDYVHFVAIAFATEQGTEMPLTYGQHVLVPSSGTLTVDGKTYTSTSKGYLDVINKASWKKHVPSTIVALGQAAIDSYLRGLYKDGWDWSIQLHMDNLDVDSCVAWGGIFADGYAAARALVKKYIPLYGRSKLWSMSTNLRINPPKNPDGSPDWSAPKSEWSYANWSKTVTDLHLLIMSLVPAGTLPKVGFQTAGNVNSTGGYGMPPQDWPYAALDAYTNYGAMFLETYTGVFSNATYGANNRTVTKNTIQPALADNAALADATPPVGFDNVLHAVVPAAHTGAYGVYAFTDAADFFYLLEIASLSTPGQQSLLESFTAGSLGMLKLTVGADLLLSIQWDGSEVWADAAGHELALGDIVEVHHFNLGTASGFDLLVNGAPRAQSNVLEADADINSCHIGLVDATEGEVRFKRVAGDPSFWVGEPAPPNTTPPAVTIQPLPLSVTVTGITVSAKVTETEDGVGDVLVSVNDGPTTEMLYTGSGDIYSAPVTLKGTSGKSVDNLITVTATDAAPVPLTTSAEASVAVVLPFGTGIGGSVAFTRTLLLGTGQFAAMHDRWIAMGHFLEGVAPPEATAENTGDVTAALGATVNLGAMDATVASGWAFIEGDDNLNQGMYADFNDADVTVTQADGAPSAGNQRVDVLVAFIDDSEHTVRTDSVDQMAFAWVTGQAGAGASLTDKSTWPDLPPSALPLAIGLADETGYIDSIDCRKAYGPALWGEDGNRYRLGIDADGILGVEPVLAWPDWVATA